jgi:exodeoxyribonuclease VII small subunit
MTAKPSKSTKPNFEQAVAELEAIVAQLESGQLPLETSLAAYKRGAELLQLCQQSLSNAEQQVRILNDANQLSAFENHDE